MKGSFSLFLLMILFSFCGFTLVPVNGYYHSRVPFLFENGGMISELEVSYETYGRLNAKKNNVILICHYFSGNKHAAGTYPGDKKAGWWDSLIGPGKAFDTNKYFVICMDSLACMHTSDKVKTSGPKRINPKTKKPWGMSFPLVTVKDMVRVQKRVLNSLGIKELVAVSGPSMGGIQSLQWAVSYPEMVKKCIPVAASPVLDGFAMFFPLRVGMQAIQNDPNFQGGEYYESKNKPAQGMTQAIFGLAVIARGRDWLDKQKGGRNYDRDKSPWDGMNHYFDSEKSLVEGVASRAQMYDANSYLYISKANILFDLYKGYQTKAKLHERLKSDFLLIAEDNDIFVLPSMIKEFYKNIKDVRPNSKYYSFDSPLGHLGSVANGDLFADSIREFLGQ
jgi:homoserine O-acetyltransferase